MDKAAPTVTLVVGILMCIFHRKLGAQQVQGQNLLWGFRMGDRSVRTSQYATLAVGVAAIVLGVLGLFS